MLDDLPTLTQTVEIHRLGANKKLGQHFLLDMNVTHNIARLATPMDGSTVFEVGPGPGGLTRALLLNGADHVIAIEMDSRFLAPLEDIRKASGTRLTTLNDDALRVDIAKIAQDMTPKNDVKIAANLPYNVGTKLLTNWLTATPLFWSQAVLMFQKEVAERICATPEDNAYGRLAILTQSVCQARMAFDIPARAFTPPPKVDSAVVVLDPLPIETRYKDLKKLGQVTEAAFGQRRKMLRRSLKTIAARHDVVTEDWLEACEIEPTRRPETLPIKDFHKLSDYLLSHPTLMT